jgi:hypothetical protein
MHTSGGGPRFRGNSTRSITICFTCGGIRIYRVDFTSHESELLILISGLIISVCLGDCFSSFLHQTQQDFCLLEQSSVRGKTVSAARAAFPHVPHRSPPQGLSVILPTFLKHSLPASKSKFAFILLRKSVPMMASASITHAKLVAVRLSVYCERHQLFPFHSEFVPSHSIRRGARAAYS